MIKACEQLGDEISRRVTDEYPTQRFMRDSISGHASRVLIDWMLGDFQLRD